jgi:hypothetical protein
MNFQMPTIRSSGQELRQTGPLQSDIFALSRFRQLVDAAAKETGGDRHTLEAICPFGFELTQDAQFLRRQLKRFFLYIGSPGTFNRASDDIALTFFDHLFHNILNIDPRFADQIAVLVIDRDSHFKRLLKPQGYQPQPQDKVFTIEHRVYSADLLTDYADFLISTLFELTHRTLPQLARFDSSENIRRRVFQLYIACEYIFGHFAPPPGDADEAARDEIYRLNTARIGHYFAATQSTAPTDREVEILDIVLKRVDLIYSLVASHKAHLITRQVKSYNSDEMFTFSMDVSIYKQSVDLIRSRYLNYPMTREPNVNAT